MSNSHDQLERDLRAALRSVDHLPVSGDAWQQNQRRLAESRRRRGSRLLMAAAAVVVVLLVGGLVAVVTRGGDGATPANGDHDSRGGTSDSMSSNEVFAEGNLLGPIVELERVTVGGETAVREAALTDTSGKGPSLCDRVVTTRTETGSCSSREPSADKPTVAFDWLTSVLGDGTTGVLGGVDDRVVKVQIWLDNGDMTLADLKPSGWEDTKLFALTVPADGPRPQRLVAYSDFSGTVLQAVDLAAAFGDSQPPQGEKACAGAVAATWHKPGSADTGDLSVVLRSGSVEVTLAESDTVGSTCLGLSPGPLAGWTTFNGRIVVAVVAPEVQSYRVERAPTGLQADLYSVSGTTWQLLVATAPLQSTFRDAQLVVFDGSERELAREYLSQPASP